MGTMRRTLTPIPGLLAAVAALGLGTPWPAAAAVSALWIAATFAPLRWAVYALLAAPLLLTAFTPVPSILHGAAPIGLAIAAGAVAPLPLRLAGRVPLRGLWPILLAPPLAVIPLLMTPWAPSYFASDITARSHVVLLAAATLLVLSIHEAAQRRRHAYAD